MWHCTKAYMITDSSAATHTAMLNHAYLLVLYGRLALLFNLELTTDQRHPPPLKPIRRRCHNMRQHWTLFNFQSCHVTSTHEAYQYRYRLRAKSGISVSAENDVLGLTLICKKNTVRIICSINDINIHLKISTNLKRPSIAAALLPMILVMKILVSPSTCGLSVPPAMLNPRPVFP